MKRRKVSFIMPLHIKKASILTSPFGLRVIMPRKEKYRDES